MNIFVTDLNPFKAAKNLCDAHVIKMIVESCQLLSTQDRLKGLTESRYKITHMNHPCRKCLTNEFNYIWLQYHLYGLCKEYTYRFGKIHKSQSLLEKYWLRKDSDELYTHKVDFLENYYELLQCTSFPQAMNNEFKNNSTDIFDVVKAYRNYYHFKKNNLSKFKYTKRNQPKWL